MPGKERWPVKTGTDQDIHLVAQDKLNGTAGVRVDSSVEQLIQLRRPGNMMPATQEFSHYQSARARPVETTVYTIEAEIIACKIEVDGDFHIVIQGDSGKTMIVEVPDPDPAFVNPASPWVSEIKVVRQACQQKLSPERGIKKVRQRARITGVGFFDRIHGQDGVAQTNGIELHPVLGIEWLAEKK
jgi:hypothetical protein